MNSLGEEIEDADDDDEGGAAASRTSIPIVLANGERRFMRARRKHAVLMFNPRMTAEAHGDQWYYHMLVRDACVYDQLCMCAVVHSSQACTLSTHSQVMYVPWSGPEGVAWPRNGQEVEGHWQAMFVERHAQVVAGQGRDAAAGEEILQHINVLLEGMRNGVVQPIEEYLVQPDNGAHPNRG